jgi:hypothetical protein
LQPELLHFQRRFAAALASPATGAMAVYRNTVLHGAVEALRGNYPVVEQILGAEMFEGVAVDHASECPPRQPVMALYGTQFADWLEQQPWIGDLPYLADVARVERLRIECLMAADAAPLSATDVCKANLGGLSLKLHPALRFAWLSTPAMSIWLAHQRPLSSELTPNWKAEGALFARPKPLLVHSPRIGSAAHRMLSGIRLGETVGESLNAAARRHPDENCDAVLASLINLGAFAALPSERI